MSTKVSIGNYEITDKTIDQFISGLAPEQKMYKDIPDFRAQIQKRLEEICLFAMLGEEQKVEEDPDYIEAMTLAKRDIISQIALSKVLGDITVSDEEVKEYFEANQVMFATEASVSAKHILVDSEEKAKSIQEEIAEGTKSFEEAAKEYSTCPSSSRGGDLGAFGHGQMVKEFDEAAFSAPLDTVVGPVKTQFGYHLILTYDKTEGSIPSFDTVEAKVRSQLMNQRQQKVYDETVAKLREKYC